MIYIRKGEENKIALSLTEKSSISSGGKFFFDFQYDSGHRVTFTMSDRSPFTRRYNLFTLKEGPDWVPLSPKFFGAFPEFPETTSGDQVILPIGWGSYQIREYIGIPVTLLPNIIERGRFLVK